MKFGLNLLVCAAGGLTWWSAAYAATADLPGNPYQPIVERNVFGLKPPPPPPDPGANKPPPPKIIVTGITTLMNKKRALLKTPGPAPKPGEKAKGEQSYILSVGEGQDGIEVLDIDENAGTVKVNNSGEVVTLDLVKDGQKPSAGVPTPMPGGMPGGIPAPGAIPAPVNPAAGVPGTPTYPRSIRSNMGVTQGGYNPQAMAPGYPGASGNPGQNLSLGTPVNYANGQSGGFSAAAQRTPEQNVLLYEANRANNQNIPGRPRLPMHPNLANPNAGVDPADFPPPPAAQAPQ
jgi:hypothetical protein